MTLLSTKRNWLPCALFAVFSSVFVFFGFVSRQRMLLANPCQMTYSRPHLDLVPVSSSIENFELYIHGSARSLNPTPVIFIPGNSGSAMQVRSFASETHNSDEAFQYFALQFNDAMSATHGSVVIKQAVFLNDALSTILSLYRGQGGDIPEHVILLAHSAGGMVARTALLLSNYPHLAVSSIIMLGSPNIRPTYTPDVSLDMIYKKVNLAWRRSMYNTTTACQSAYAVAQYLQRGDVPDKLQTDASSSSLEHFSLTLTTPVLASWECSVNVPRTRLISISGGEVDMEVPSPLTSLSALAPRPQNMSAEQMEPQRISTFLKPKGGYVRYIFSKLVSLPSLLFNFIGYLKNSSAKDAAEVASEDSTAMNATDGNSSSAYPVFRRMEDITQDHWNTHIMPYVEPPHVYIRTSQMLGVGFPVDHKALLWCHQVVGGVTRIMKRLSAVPGENQLSAGDMNKMIKRKKAFSLPTWPAKDDFLAGQCKSEDVQTNSSKGAENSCLADTHVPIPAVQEELLRNASKHSFSRVALDTERKYMHSMLTTGHASNSEVLGNWKTLVGSLSVLSLSIVTSHITTILTCYIAISLLVMASYVLYHVSLKSKWSVSATTHLYATKGYLAEMALLQPENHLFLCSLVDLVIALLPSFLSPYVLKVKSSKVITIGSVFIVAAVALHVTLSSQDPTEFIRSNGWYAQWVVSYGCALALQFIIISVVFAIRAVVNRLYAFAVFLMRATLWCKPIRSALRPVLKPLRKFYDRFPSCEWVILLVMMCSMVAGSVLFRRHISGLSAQLIAGDSVTVPYVGRLLQACSLLFLLAFVLFLVALSAAVVWPQAESSWLLTPVICISIPGIVLSAPTVRFSVDVLASSPQRLATLSTISVIADMFGPDMVNYSLAMFFMALNLIYLQRHEETIRPVAFLYEIFDAAKNARMGVKSTSTLFSLIPFASASDCIHEDGGSSAIFEENKEGVDSLKTGAVLLGPAFRVISCDCSITKSKFSEWCEWCRCDKCGGKSISRAARTRAGGDYFDANDQSAARKSLGMRDISSDLLVLAVLVASVGYILLCSSSEPYLLFLAMGAVSASMCIGRTFRYGGY